LLAKMAWTWAFSPERMATSFACIGLDVHRDFAQVAIWENGRVKDAGRVATSPERLREFSTTLRKTDRVALEATMNTAAIAGLLGERAGEVVVSNPLETRVIAEAKIKTDKVDARVLAELLAANYLPSVWQADDKTKALRRQVGAHIALVRQRTRVKNQVQAILARNLLPRCPFSDLFGINRRRWLGDQELAADERRTVRSLLRQLDFAGEELKLVDAKLARAALDDPHALRLMTIPGVDMAVAIAIVATVGDFSRFESPDKLVSYVGLNPSTRQSGGLPATHGRISKQGRAWARGMLVEAAHAACHTPGPLHAFFERVKARRGWQIATVAVARKLLVICWHMIHDERDYAYARPSLVAKKTRARELRAGAPAHRGRPAGSAAAYNLRTVRDRERALGEQAEAAYNHLTRSWQQTRTAGKAQPASPKRARPSSVPSPNTRAVKVPPAGGSADLDPPAVAAPTRKPRVTRLNA
jgi:transposase